MTDSTTTVLSPTTPKTPIQIGPKYKLITESDVQVCRLNHTRTIVSKIMNSRYLRRWESHTIVLDHNEIRSTTVSIPLKVQYVILFTFYDTKMILQF
jgi:hypothetical protein